jgi:hypothetical protein
MYNNRISLNIYIYREREYTRVLDIGSMGCFMPRAALLPWQGAEDRRSKATERRDDPAAPFEPSAPPGGFWPGLLGS